MFLFKKTKGHLGIDIGASAVKIVELEKEEGRHKLNNYTIFSLEDYSEGLKVSNEEMAEIIKRIMLVW